MDLLLLSLCTSLSSPRWWDENNIIHVLSIHGNLPCGKNHFCWVSQSTRLDLGWKAASPWPAAPAWIFRKLCGNWDSMENLFVLECPEPAQSSCHAPVLHAHHQLPRPFQVDHVNQAGVHPKQFFHNNSKLMETKPCCYLPQLDSGWWCRHVTMHGV